MAFYAKVVTRGSGGSAKGSPSQAVDYITDGHDFRKEPGYSDEELAYIARLGEGWKTDLEGGRVPLVGYGTLDGEKDQEALSRGFEEGCQPYGVRDGTTGYKSITLTLPKEVSLFSEGNREKAREAMHAAIGPTLEKAFPGKELAAVAAIHTRNDNGEIHYHAHVLVGKFVRDRETGRVHSINGKTLGNKGNETLNALKDAWKDEVTKEFKERLGLGIEQPKKNGPAILTLEDGTRLEHLNRESRRILEKQLEPTYSRTTPSGAVVQSRLKLNEMDARIFEVAAGNRGKDGWTKEAFTNLFPKETKFIDRYEKRVETLRSVGYLNTEGRITEPFRTHFAAKHGLSTPELQRLRIDLAQAAQQSAGRQKIPVLVPSVWDAMGQSEAIRRRVERLGLTDKDLEGIHRKAQEKRPSKATLDRIRDLARAQGRGEAEKKIRSGELPKTKGVFRAYMDLQKTKVQRTYLTLAAAFRGDYTERKLTADKLVNHATRDLELAKDRRLAQVGRVLKPVFRVVKATLPKEARRIERATRNMVKVATFKEERAYEKQAMEHLFGSWRSEFVDQPMEVLKQRAAALDLPSQQQGRKDLEAIRNRIQVSSLDREVGLFKDGKIVLEQFHPDQASHLESWKGREPELVEKAVRMARGEAKDLPQETYDAALKAGRIGATLEREKKTAQISVPSRLQEIGADLQKASGRIRALGLKDPFTKEALGGVAPMEIKRGLDQLRTAGLLGDGPDWALKASSVKPALESLSKGFLKDIDADRSLTDQLLKQRRA